MNVIIIALAIALGNCQVDETTKDEVCQYTDDSGATHYVGFNQADPDSTLYTVRIGRDGKFSGTFSDGTDW